MFKRTMLAITLVGAMVVGSLAMPLTAQARGGHHGHHGHHGNGGHHGSHVSFYYGGGYGGYNPYYYSYPAVYAPRSYYGYYGPSNYYDRGCYGGSGVSFSIGF